MHRVVLATLFVVMAVSALAQDAAPPAPRFDLYVGIGNVRAIGGSHASDDHGTGPVVRFGWNLSPRVGLVFDGGVGVTSEGQVDYSLTAGPRLAFANPSRLVLFVQVVAGVIRDRNMTAASPVTYDARLAAQAAAGGGLDVVVNHRWAVRALHVEGRRVLASGTASDLIISAGVVLKLGSGREPVRSRVSH
jgi:hypothetical protein